MRLIGFLFLLLLSLPALADKPLFLESDFMQAECRDIDNRQVIMVITHYVPISTGAASGINDNVPIIYFGYDLLAELPTDHHANMFVYFHECGHHALGHIKKYLNNTKDVIDLPTIEHEADCYAVTKFIKKYGNDVFSQALSDLRIVVNPYRESLILSCPR